LTILLQKQNNDTVCLLPVLAANVVLLTRYSTIVMILNTCKVLTRFMQK